jgi:hypothetical protein
MIVYVGWVFYLSEPKYVDNCYKVPQRYDYVSLPKYSFRDRLEVENGIVLQVDSATILVKTHKWSDKFHSIPIHSNSYRVIGKGTIYHKVNDYVGFNIMMITQFIIGILIAILIYFVTGLMKEFL